LWRRPRPKLGCGANKRERERESEKENMLDYISRLEDTGTPENKFFGYRSTGRRCEPLRPLAG
jgi:hypothetical protein